MSKVNFSKVEKSFEQALQKLFIEQLSELASIANAIQDPERSISKGIEETIIRVQNYLKKIKKQDPNLFAKLNLSIEDEERLARPLNEYVQADWLLLQALKLRIDELRRELQGQGKLDVEYDDQIAKERRRHINKRFNIKDGWLPLH